MTFLKVNDLFFYVQYVKGDQALALVGAFNKCCHFMAI